MRETKFIWPNALGALLGLAFCLWQLFHVEDVFDVLWILIIGRLTWQAFRHIWQTGDEIAAANAARKLARRAVRRKFGPLWPAAACIGPALLGAGAVLALTTGGKYGKVIVGMFVVLV